MRSPETNSQKTILVSKRHLTFLFLFVALLVAAVVYLFFNQDNFLYELEGYKKPLGNLTISRGSKMVKAYYDQFNPKPAADQPEIVRSVYFDFGPLAQYIRKMHNRYDATGIRIYFAKYDSNEMRQIQQNPNNPATYLKDLKGYCTVVIIPTKKDQYGNIVDDIVKRDRSGNNQLLDSLEQPVSMFGTEYETQAQNAGISCPPYPAWVCNGQSLISVSVGDLSFLKTSTK